MLERRTQTNQPHLPIDTFLASLAAEKRGDAVAVRIGIIDLKAGPLKL